MFIDHFIWNLQKKYPNNSITHKYDDNNIILNVDETKIECELDILNEGYDLHGIKFINAFIDMLEHHIINNDAISETTE